MTTTANAGRDGAGLKVVKAALRVVPVADVGVDPTYQRGLVPKHRKIAAEFSEEALGVPVIAQRPDGSLWVVDGQQRLAALRLLDIKQVRADVFASAGPKHEAEVFRLINMNRTKLNSKDEFFALLAGGDEYAVLVKQVADAEGFTITRGGGNTGKADSVKLTSLTTVGTLLKIAKRGGREAVQFALSVIRRAWPHDPDRTRIEIVEGLYRFWNASGGDVDADRLVPRLATTTPGRIIYTANAGVGDRCSNAARVMSELYAKRAVRQTVKGDHAVK